MSVSRQPERRHAPALKGPAGAILLHAAPFLLLSAHVFLKTTGGDEPEHLHFAYLVGSGMKPYRDFMQHHMPLLWYVLAPIAFIPGFVAKVVFSKLVELGVLAVSLRLLALAFRDRTRWTTWAFCLFFLFLAPYNDFIDIRPELICFPFVVAVAAFLLRAPVPGMREAVLWGVLCGVHLLLTPRVYPHILLLTLALLLRPLPARVKGGFVLSGALSALAVFAYFGPQDILFFVFQLNADTVSLPLSKLRYPRETALFLLTFIPACALLQLWRLRPAYLLLFALNIVSAGLWCMESNPYPYSTSFILLVDLVFLIDWVQRHLRSRTVRLAIFGALASVTVLLTYRKNIYRKQFNLFARAGLYEARLEACAGGSFQNMGVDNRNHPIFIRDYTYFAFIMFPDEIRNTPDPDAVAAAKIDKVLRHTAGRGIRYVGDRPPCYVEPRVGRILQRALPNAHIIVPDSASSPFTRIPHAFAHRRTTRS